MRVLVIDVGGTHVKVLATGQTEPIKIRSGPKMNAKTMVRDVRRATRRWRYDVVSIGYPGVVIRGKIITEPWNLGQGWSGFDFARAFGTPVKVINDAAMQALGSYNGGHMLFLGLGTGLGSALIVDGVLEPMELAHLPYKKGRSYEEYVGDAGLKRMGRKKWVRYAMDVIMRLKTALEADDVVIGGGNARLLAKLHTLPRHVRIGSNDNAFVGGFRLWESPDGQNGRVPRAPAQPSAKSRRGQSTKRPGARRRTSRSGTARRK